MTKEAQQSEARARAIEGAVEWRVRFDEGRSDESDPDFRAWLAASPEHAAAMARAETGLGYHTGRGACLTRRL